MPPVGKLGVIGGRCIRVDEKERVASGCVWIVGLSPIPLELVMSQHCRVVGVPL